MPPVPIDEPLGYRRGRGVSYNEAVGTAPIPHGHAIVNSPPPNHSPQPKDQSVRYGGPYSSTPWDRPRRVIAKVEHHLGELFPRVGFIVTTLGTNRAVVRFYNQRRTAEQWIQEGKTATHWTRLSCHRFRANEVDRKSTRLNSSHSQISYAVFCLKKKKNDTNVTSRAT